MGANETGGQAALPMWMTYMSRALKGAPEAELEPPEGVVAVTIDPSTGMREADGRSNTLEFFYRESVPGSGGEGGAARDSARPPEDVKNQIF
jgi:penicillin-binding protein 1A